MGRSPHPAPRVHLEAHLSRTVTLDELAVVAGVGRFRLVRAFGTTPAGYQRALAAR